MKTFVPRKVSADVGGCRAVRGALYFNCQTSYSRAHVCVVDVNTLTVSLLFQLVREASVPEGRRKPLKRRKKASLSICLFALVGWLQ